MQYTFPPDEVKDQGVPGRHQASHVEAQLMACFLHEHCADRLQELRSHRFRWSDAEVAGWKCHHVLGDTSSPAVVLVNLTPCPHCNDFRDYIWDAVSVHFELPTALLTARTHHDADHSHLLLLCPIHPSH